MYNSKAKTTKITFTSRSAVKIRDNYYTVEASEERSIPAELDDVDVSNEWSILCDAVNAVVDAQIEQIVKTFK